MMKRRFIVAVLLAWGLVVATTGCGDDDGGGETPALGTCDLRSVSYTCIELHGASATDVDNQKAGCDENGGDWSTDACPTDQQLGCCEYEFGNAFRECFYTGTMADYEYYCIDMMDGTWIEEI